MMVLRLCFCEAETDAGVGTGAGVDCSVFGTAFEERFAEVGGGAGVAEAVGVATDDGAGVSEAAADGVASFGKAAGLEGWAAERERRDFAGFLDGRGV